ncbi:hypothetical protein JKP88DRAFT_270434 [Tribonema minus]|uniref:Uncharacterized protein n=1 Tax=Tribonema minus TaxID=303371 RepID=A0A835YPL0_9STRA|nr:hypothetical protein JKP88DRAFT_270434 [Tribonema minus]
MQEYYKRAAVYSQKVHPFYVVPRVRYEFDHPEGTGHEVVTDIDDTVKSSGNLRLAGLIPLGGIDAQYERGQFYPGVFQFALELAAHGTPQGLLPLPVAVLTARAKEFLFALELKTEHPVSIAYRQCGTDNGFDGWGLGPVLYGSVKEWIVWTRKGRRKFKNFKRLMEIDGTHAAARGCATDYIFIGDTGEGDTKAGVKMCETFPRELRAMFMHAVSCDSEYCITPDDYTINGVPVLFFKTYVGAARKAYEAGLMDKAGVQRVIDRSVMELELSGAPRDCSKWEDMEMDIEQALM